jgi:hypothetical protein
MPDSKTCSAFASYMMHCRNEHFPSEWAGRTDRRGTRCLKQTDGKQSPVAGPLPFLQVKRGDFISDEFFSPSVATI